MWKDLGTLLIKFLSMSKRFVDTEMFSDDWFMDLSKDGKIMWFYLITMCDHAGILKLNEKLCKFHTGISDPLSVIEQLGNRIVSVKDHLFFIPKFIEFQYPNFPNSKVRQQESAVAILKKHGLFINGIITLPEDLLESYDSDSGILKGGVGEPELNIPFETFWNLYGKKEDRIKCEGKWKRLTDGDRKACIEAVPTYVKSTPDTQYRKNPATYLNNKSWENEIRGVLPPPIKRGPQAGIIPGWKPKP